MPKLKIGLVCPYNITIAGGVQSIVLLLADQLNAMGHDTKILTPRPRNIKKIKSDNPDIIFIGRSTDFRSPLHTTVQISASAYNDKINQILLDQQFDIINLHEPWVPFLSRQILQRSESVNIGTFHAKIPESVMTRSLVKVVNPYLKSVINNLDGLTACSDSAAEYVRSLTKKPIKIIPNGVNLDNFKSKSDPVKIKKNPEILYIGRLETRKGVKYLIEAFNLLNQKHPEVSLIIAGDGPNRNYLKDLTTRYRLDKVKFLGNVDDTTKVSLLKKSDLFCSPAIYGESFGIVLLEAMASSVITVAGDNSGYRDVMKNIGQLSIVNVHDIPSFASRLEMMLYEKDIRRVWLNWSQDYIKNFDFKFIVDQYKQYYLDLLA